MKFSAAALLAAVAGAHAWTNVTYTTEVVTAVTTFCPEPTEITYGGSTYTVTKATTLTINNCPCTVTKPVTVISSVICKDCSGYQNKTSTAVPTKPTSVGTISATKAASTTTALATAGAGKAVTLSGAGLAGVLGLAAFFL